MASVQHERRAPETTSSSSLSLGYEMTLLSVGSMPQDLAMCNIDLFTPGHVEQHRRALVARATLVSGLSPV